MRIVETGKFMVMSAVTVTDYGVRMNEDGGATVKINSEPKSMFDRNATDIDTREQAAEEAERRNRIEQENGNTNIEWFPCPQTAIEW